MEAETLVGITALRDHIQTLVDEGLMEADLVSIWPHVRHKWVTLFPESEPVLAKAETRGPAFGLLVVLETANHVVVMQERAARLRDQSEALNGMVENLFSQFLDKGS